MITTYKRRREGSGVTRECERVCERGREEGGSGVGVEGERRVEWWSGGEEWRRGEERRGREECECANDDKLMIPHPLPQVMMMFKVVLVLLELSSGPLSLSLLPLCVDWRSTGWRGGQR